MPSRKGVTSFTYLFSTLVVGCAMMEVRCALYAQWRIGPTGACVSVYVGVLREVVGQ